MNKLANARSYVTFVRRKNLILGDHHLSALSMLVPPQSVFGPQADFTAPLFFFLWAISFLAEIYFSKSQKLYFEEKPMFPAAIFVS